jgi:Na+:H+ antiporter, NhaA family
MTKKKAAKSNNSCSATSIQRNSCAKPKNDPSNTTLLSLPRLFPTTARIDFEKICNGLCRSSRTIPEQEFSNLPTRRHIANRLATSLRDFTGGEAAAGLLLMLAAATALLLANSPWAGAYHAAFHAPLPWTPIPALANGHDWINDAAMALFFFAAGLEIKRELVDGELSSPAKRRLPVLAAACGMAVPALVYLAAGGGSSTLRAGWAIPAATDIAFALGVLALLGRRAPASLRVFLLTVAIADDLGAVAIIALVYTAGVSMAWLAGGLVCLGAMAVLGRLKLGNGWTFAALAVLVWYCTLHSGVHPTVAAVAAAFAVPLGLDRKGGSLLLRMEHALVPWNGFVIVPLFGFANAGTSLTAIGPGGLLAPLPLAIAAGLFAGKQAGILGAIFAAEKLGFARRPAGTSWAQLWGMAMLCGIGFTMSLFIAALAFPAQPELVEQAKLGVLAGSLASALLGYTVLRLASRN